MSQPAPQIRITAQLIAGLVLAALGVLFTLDNLRLVHAREVLRYWPAALLIIGIEGHEPMLFAAGVLLFLLAITVHYLLLAFEFAREAEQRRLQLEVLAREAKLRALRAQLDPHFLYNSLNSISALTTVDPAGARRMCICWQSTCATR